MESLGPSNAGFFISFPCLLSELISRPQSFAPATSDAVDRTRLAAIMRGSLLCNVSGTIRYYQHGRTHTTPIYSIPPMDELQPFSVLVPEPNQPGVWATPLGSNPQHMFTRAQRLKRTQLMTVTLPQDIKTKNSKFGVLPM